MLRSTRVVIGLQLLACLAVAGVGLGGCASQSRHDEVKAASREVQAVLDAQLKAALSEEPSSMDLPPPPSQSARRDRPAVVSASRQARIDRLTSIKYQLSAANIALGAVPYALQQPAERETAYTFLEEVYSTLAWNAKLPPDGLTRLRPLPVNPLPGKLNFAPVPER